MEPWAGLGEGQNFQDWAGGEKLVVPLCGMLLSGGWLVELIGAVGWLLWQLPH